jgi:hypothetical protein
MATAGVAPTENLNYGNGALTKTFEYQSGGNNTVSSITGTDPNYKPPAPAQTPQSPSEIRQGHPRGYEAARMTAIDAVTPGSIVNPAVNDFQAQMNGGLIATVVTGMSGAPAATGAKAVGNFVAGAAKETAATLTTTYLMNAPQINSFVGGAAGQYFPGGTPSVPQNVFDAAGRGAGWIGSQIVDPLE